MKTILKRLLKIISIVFALFGVGVVIVFYLLSYTPTFCDSDEFKEAVSEGLFETETFIEICDDLKNKLNTDKQYVLQLLKKDESVWKYVGDSFKKDKDFVLAAIKRGENALAYADDSLKKDKDVVLAAIKQDVSVLYYADDSLKKDKNFMLAAIEENTDAIHYADDSLKKEILSELK